MLVWTNMAWQIIWVLVALGAVWGYLRFFEWRNLYYPSRELDATPSWMVDPASGGAGDDPSLPRERGEHRGSRVDGRGSAPLEGERVPV